DLLAIFSIIFFINNIYLVWFVYLKLLKNVKFFASLKENEMKYANYLNLVFFIYWTSLFAHWISSGYLILSPNSTGMSFEDRYLRSIYWCVTTLTTIGYGDITPTTNAQIIYTMFVEILGVGIFGYLIANITGIVSKLDPAKQYYLQRIERLAALVKYRNIPKELQEKIKNYYLYIREKRLGYSESDVLVDLPIGLRNELSLSLKRDIIKKIPLFFDSSTKFIEEIAIHLNTTIVTPGEYLFKAGDEANEMYFLVSGSILILDAEEKTIIANLKHGDYFGELALVKNSVRNATVKAVDYCDLYTLEKKVFIKIVHKYPEIGLKIEEKIKNITEMK
nr:cyclic nucleotide-binding domain-containing protein [Melioribacteraceae bacterium]